MDCQRDFAWSDIVRVAVHYGIGTVYGYRHYGKSELSGQHEGTAFEGEQMAVVGAGSFREYDYAHTFAEGLLRILYGLLYAGYGAVVHKYMTYRPASEAYKRHLFKTLLHKPLESVSKEAVYGPDVKGSLMVGHEDIALFLLQILTAYDLDPYKEQGADTAGPNHRRPISSPAL